MRIRADHAHELQRTSRVIIIIYYDRHYSSSLFSSLDNYFVLLHRRFNIRIINYDHVTIVVATFTFCFLRNCTVLYNFRRHYKRYNARNSSSNLNPFETDGTLFVRWYRISFNNLCGKSRRDELLSKKHIAKLAHWCFRTNSNSLTYITIGRNSFLAMAIILRFSAKLDVNIFKSKMTNIFCNNIIYIIEQSIKYWNYYNFN